jgi:beta-phosphoglucomutase-like phosphatase (HAD superfamily)
MGSPITRDQFDAVLLDLDGVITDTASLHAAAWKQMFDGYLQNRAAEAGEPFRPFDIVSDYQHYVDGKLRYDGVRDFLASRNIHLPEGTPDDTPENETVGGLGNRKDALVNKVISEQGVEPYEGSVRLIRQLRRCGWKCDPREPTRRKTSAGCVSDGGQAAGGRAEPCRSHRGCHFRSPGGP